MNFPMIPSYAFDPRTDEHIVKLVERPLWAKLQYILDDVSKQTRVIFDIIGERWRSGVIKQPQIDVEQMVMPRLALAIDSMRVIIGKMAEEDELRHRYPCLQDAYDKYQMVLTMCKSEEQ